LFGVIHSGQKMLALTKTWRWINALVFWLLDAWRFCPKLFLVVVLVVFIFGYLLPGTIDDRVRYCGLALQVIGISIVAWGLRDRRRLFNLPSLLDKFRGCLRRFPRWGAKPQTNSFSGTGGYSFGGGGKVSSWIDAPPEASIEVRLAALEANVKSLKTEQAEIAKELQEETRRWIEAVDSERLKRESGVMEIRNLVNTLGAGGLHLEWAGVFWLILGVVLATIPNEIAGWLKWFS
jgi:hypothetical protein